MISKNQVSCHFGRRSQVYDEYAVVQKKMGHSLLKLVKDAENFWNILEIGCGTGFLTALLAKMYPRAKITASDISSEMLTVASEKLSQYENVSYVLEDGENLRLPEKFDLIVSNAAFQWFNGYQQAFTQMEHHLRKSLEGILFMLHLVNKPSMN
jgi:malonyl-CoA O-methyltransferase